MVQSEKEREKVKTDLAKCEQLVNVGKWHMGVHCIFFEIFCSFKLFQKEVRRKQLEKNALNCKQQICLGGKIGTAILFSFHFSVFSNFS